MTTRYTLTAWDQAKQPLPLRRRRDNNYPVTITGTVTGHLSRFATGSSRSKLPQRLPCVSDASMSQFMEAVYMQQPMPTNTTGVQVTLTAIDPNHNLINIGTTTTDSKRQIRLLSGHRHQFQEHTKLQLHSAEPIHTTVHPARTYLNVQCIIGNTSTNSYSRIKPGNNS